MSSANNDVPVTESQLSAKQSREEIERAKAKLVDQKFDITKYPDPFAPRQGSAPQFLPQGVTEEMERRWLATIAASRDESG